MVSLIVRLMSKMPLPVRLKAARAKSNRSQAKVATELGVTQATISGWERGLVVPPAHRVPEIERVYGIRVTLADLLPKAA